MERAGYFVLYGMAGMVIFFSFLPFSDGNWMV